MICSVEGCRNHPSVRIDHGEESVKCFFHRFPKDTSIREKWIKFCHRPATWKGLNGRICSDHFLPGDYENECKTVLKKHAVPTKQTVPLTKPIRDLRIIIPSKEHSICMQRRKRTPRKLVLPQQDEESTNESSLDDSGAGEAEVRQYRIHSEEGSNYSSDTADMDDWPTDSKCYKIVCTVVNPSPSSENRVSTKRTKELEKLNELNVLKRKLDNGEILFKSDHLKHMKEIIKQKNIFERKCSTFQSELEKSQKHIEELNGDKLRILELENKNLRRQCASFKESVNKEKNNVQETTKKLKDKINTIKTMENDIKLSQHLKNPAAIIRGNIECLLKRVFSENQVNMLLLKKNVITWTSEEMDSFLKLSQKISKSAYIFLINDMKLPLPGTNELESFSNKYYPGLPVFSDRTDIEQQGTVGYAVSTSKTIATVPVPVSASGGSEYVLSTTTGSEIAIVNVAAGPEYTVPAGSDVATVNATTNSVDGEMVYIVATSDTTNQILITNS